MRFIVKIQRIDYKRMEFSVDAHSEEEAEDKASQEAADHDWSGKKVESEYVVDEVSKDLDEVEEKMCQYVKTLMHTGISADDLKALIDVSAGEVEEEKENK